MNTFTRFDMIVSGLTSLALGIALGMFLVNRYLQPTIRGLARQLNELQSPPTTYGAALVEYAREMPLTPYPHDPAPNATPSAGGAYVPTQPTERDRRTRELIAQLDLWAAEDPKRTEPFTRAEIDQRAAVLGELIVHSRRGWVGAETVRDSSARLLDGMRATGTDFRNLLGDHDN